MGYHYGQTIRAYRQLKGLTLSQLAALWPSKELGVTSRYVSDIERGVKYIGDILVLRKLACILQIPLWKLGLSEYDPFQEDKADSASFFDTDSSEELIQDLWLIRQNIPFDRFEEKVKKLSIIFERQLSNNPLIKDHKDFLRLSAHKKRLEEVIYTEKHNYAASLKCAHDMLELATLSGDNVAQAIAMVRVGVELLREDNKTSLGYLEKACDMSLGMSKELIAYCYEFLARAHAQFGDIKRFEKAINTSLSFGESMKGVSVVTKDYVFHSYSAILEENSNSLILFGKGKEALKTLPEIEKHISLERNAYLGMWIPLDYAQAHLYTGDIEESIKHLKLFYEDIKDYNSDRINSRIDKHLTDLEMLEYGELPVVRDFKEMLISR